MSTETQFIHYYLGIILDDGCGCSLAYLLGCEVGRASKSKNA